MKTNTVSVISVRIRSVFIPRCGDLLRLPSAGRDPLCHGAAAPPAGLRGRGRLHPSSSPSCGGVAGLGWGRSALSHTRFAISSPVALLLLHLALLALTVISPVVKSPNPLCFDSRVCSCPFLVSICFCGMID
jgi:hypothetical protein